MRMNPAWQTSPTCRFSSSRQIEALAGHEVLGTDPHRFDARDTGALERRRVFTVRDHHHDACREIRRGAGVEQRSQITAATRGEDADGEALGARPAVGRAHAASRSRVRVAITG
jgi:hypothetical protein